MLLIELRDRCIGWEAAKTRVLSVLRQRILRNESGLTNAEVRAITHLERSQVKRLMDELRNEGQVKPVGHGRSAAWVYVLQKTGCRIRLGNG